MKTAVSLRHIFQAPKGFVWCSVDYSAMEHVIAGVLSRDENIANIYRLQYQYENGLIDKPLDPEGREYEDPKCDPHIVAASNFDAELKDLLETQPWLCNKSHPLIKLNRPKGKTLNYRVIYLGSAEGIANQLEVTTKEAEQLLNQYFGYPNGFYKLKEWLDVTVEIIKRVRYSRTPMGRVINCFEENAKGLDDINTAARRGVNATIQGCGADTTKLAVNNLVLKAFNQMSKQYQELLVDRLPRITNVSHDEINAIVPGFIKLEFKPNKKGLMQPVTVLDENQYSKTVIPQGCKGSELEEFRMAKAFSQLIKQEMEKALLYMFEDILQFNMPAKAEEALSTFWLH